MSYPSLPDRIITRAGTELALRPLAAEDIPSVMALERRVQTHPWRRSHYEDCLDGRHHCWLAECDGELLGFVVVAWGGGDGELLNIAVSPDARRRGIGRVLLQRAVEQVAPFASVMFLEVRASNRAAIAFYDREAFLEVGQRPNYYPTAHGREDALIFVRQLR